MKKASGSQTVKVQPCGFAYSLLDFLPILLRIKVLLIKPIKSRTTKKH